MREVVDRIFSYYDRLGSYRYEGEAVTQTEHALQTALQAEEAGATVPTVLGALLHDIGHLLSMDVNKEEEWALKNHGEVGKDFLSKHGLSDDVTEVVAGHVKAKRYLVFKNKCYYEKLSSHSLYTLTLQGGPMSPQEAEEFEKHPNFDDIIAVRKWDELAKEENKQTKTLQYYKDICEKFLKQKM